MNVSSEIPQDIIDSIIGELTGDSATLKRCATVSRSFLHPSRRHLFTTIRFHTYTQTERLHDLLTSVPEISLYIHELSFTIYGVYHRRACNKTLASILRMLPDLRVLSWGMEHSGGVLYWDYQFSNELRSALLDVFRSPSLTTVTITDLYLPLSVLSAFTHVKKLTLDGVELKGTSVLPPFQLAQLEVLIIYVRITPEDAEFFTPTSSSFPNLSFLSINFDSNGTALFYKRIIQSSARSIEQLVWNHCWQSIIFSPFTVSCNTHPALVISPKD
jgi:hypothetical protein